MQLAAPELEDWLRQLDDAGRVSRALLRRRATTVAGMTAVYGIWAAAVGGLAWLGLAAFLPACAFVAAQLGAPPGRDFREGMRSALLPALGPGISHQHRPAGIGLGPIVSDEGWTVEDRLDGPGWSLLSARHCDGRGLLLGRVEGEIQREVAWSLPAPLLAFTWDRPVTELKSDLDRLGAAIRELETPDPGAQGP